MSIAVFLKNNLKNIPPRLGKIINKIPYNMRPGLSFTYAKRKREIRESELFSDEQKRDFVFLRLKSLVEYAYRNTEFYRDYYDKNGFNPSHLTSFEDIRKIPLVTKKILNEHPIEKRSVVVSGRYIVNTGGSTGTPFSFYIQPNSMGHEWAHMHKVWSMLDYKHTDLVITFGGRSHIKNAIQYEVIRNHFAVNIYIDYKEVSKKLKQILKRHAIKYLAGYPSSIYDFALYCQNEDEELQELLSKNLIGAFLGSEFPHAYYRKTIENVFRIKTISWYGHTERAVLAYEKHEQFNYEPFLTYGYVEIEKDKNENCSLIGSAYYNLASPLIRYNTEDLISQPVVESGIVKSFKIIKGREGEFVTDKLGKNINLTGLIFGRHHELFNYSKFIQVKQIGKGAIEIHYVSDTVYPADALKLFDSSNANFDLIFVKRDEPYRTAAGKINLLIK